MLTCPKCKSNMIINIVYGLPGQSLRQRAAKAKVSLGGCVIGHDSQDYKCKSCNFEFSEMITLEEYLVIVLYFFVKKSDKNLSIEKQKKVKINNAYSQLAHLRWKTMHTESPDHYGFIYFTLDRGIIESAFRSFENFKKFPKDKNLQRKKIEKFKKNLYEKNSGRKTVLEPSNQFIYFELYRYEKTYEIFSKYLKEVKLLETHYSNILANYNFKEKNKIRKFESDEELKLHKKSKDQEVYVNKSTYSVLEDDHDPPNNYFEKILFLPIVDLNLSTRLKNPLKHVNINFIGDLVQETKHSLSQKPNLGIKSIKEIQKTLKLCGLSLGMKIENWPISFKDVKVLEKKLGYSDKNYAVNKINTI
tara:strand:- start:47 stop:1129 length:1083 start_codon:yes stop_codon:yes gene_type:complete